MKYQEESIRVQKSVLWRVLQSSLLQSVKTAAGMSQSCLKEQNKTKQQKQEQNLVDCHKNLGIFKASEKVRK